MFFHIFTYRLKCSIRNFEVVFWSACFPIILVTLFNFAFANMDKESIFDAFPIAVVNDAAYENDTIFQTALNEVSSDKSNSKLFDVTYTNRTDAAQLLEDEKIIGYIYLDNGFHLIIRENGIYQNIIKSFLDSYQQRFSTIQNTASANHGTQFDFQEIYEQSFLQQKENKRISSVIISFYSAIAMSCLYAGMSGISEISIMQPNISSSGCRIQASPVHKQTYFLSAISASVILQCAQISLMVLYMKYIIHVEFAKELYLILLISYVGVFIGIIIGALIAVIMKKGVESSIGVLICFTMFQCVLAGMMSPDIKYAVTKAIPIHDKINIVNLITDGIFSLIYYDNKNIYFENLIILTVMFIVLFVITCLFVRRKKYASL